MNKDFSAWHDKKQSIDTAEAPSLLYKEREVWWMKIGLNVGSEQNGSKDSFSRPVLIVKGFSKTLFWGVPMSNTANRSSYVYPLYFDGKERAVNLSQLRVLDTRRVGEKIGMISEKDLAMIRERLVNLILK